MKPHPGTGALLLAIVLAAGCGNAEKAAERAYDAGVAAAQKGDLPRATELLTKSAAAARKAGSPRLIARAEGAIGRTLFQSGDPAGALAHYHAGLDAARTLEDSPEEGDLLNYVGMVYRAGGALDSAESYYLESVSSSHRAENLQAEAAALNNLGMVARERNDVEKSGDLFLRSLGVARLAKDELGAGRALIALGDHYRSTGLPDDASQAYKEALESLRAGHPDAPEIGYIFLRQGAIYEDLGSLNEARRLYLSSLAQYQRAGDRKGQAAAGAALGALDLVEGKPKDAAERCAEALPLMRESGSFEDLSILLGNLAIARRASGDVLGAISAYREALDARGRLGDRSGAAMVYMNLGGLFEESGDFANAARAYRQARDLLLAVGDSAAASSATAASLRLKAGEAATIPSASDPRSPGGGSPPRP